MDQKKLQALLDGKFDPAEETSFFKALIYGDPGAGKTVMAHTIGNRILTIAADPAGWESLKNHPELGLGTRIELLRYRGLMTLDFLYEAIDSGAKGFNEFDTVIIDTANHIGALDLDKVTSVRIAKKGGLAETAIDSKGQGRKFDFEQDMYGVYNENTFRLRGSFLKLFSLPMNVIATAHATQREGSTKGIRDVTYPDLTPKVFASVNGMTSLVTYMTATTKIQKDGRVTYDRVIQVHPSYSIRAKTRIGGLPLTIKNPDLRSIVDSWQKLGGKLQENAEIDVVDSETKSDLEDFGLE